jgi:hypothetical protein
MSLFAVPIGHNLAFDDFQIACISFPIYDHLSKRIFFYHFFSFTRLNCKESSAPCGESGAKYFQLLANMTQLSELQKMFNLFSRLQNNLEKGNNR